MSRRTPPTERDAIIWPCPHCNVRGGAWCASPDGARRAKLHKARFDFARRHPTRSLPHLARHLY